ncbi:23S ribosomal RNA methyltransferase Erm [Haloglycomyces albus]|uniref:23S ribosomal RNA methyltransferase Erm n=1 Tax=Haloglycomyces albus TaxID=526067 RepID=UPI00046D5C18|nr:23S ribosomal RNA methyltransferase Erm [Haloglycomyces albus]
MPHTSPSYRHRTHSKNGKRRKLSQNFLVDRRQIQRLIELCNVEDTDTVMEIGPGDGALTSRLVTSARRVIAYEYDPHYVARLRKRFADIGTFTCHHGDAATARAPRTPFIAVGNLPFHISTDMVRWAVRARALRYAVFLTQKDFALKQAGGRGRYTKLVAEAAPLAEFRYLGTVPREAFRPRPNVASGILRIERHGRPLLPAGLLPFHREVVDLGYSGKGGSVAASLRRVFPNARVARALDRAGASRRALAGEVSPRQWLHLTEALAYS